MNMTLEEFDALYAEYTRRNLILRSNPDVQAIIDRAMQLNDTELHALHTAWLNHFRIVRSEQLRTWHAFVKAYGPNWREVLTVKQQATALMGFMDTGNGCWGHTHAVADAVAAVLMADHITAEQAIMYARPWRVMYGGQA